MNFPLDDLRSLAASLGETLREPLAHEGQRLLSDADLVDALQVVEEIGRWADAARLGIAGEVGHRSEPGTADVTLTTVYGCGSASEIMERAIHISGATARTRLRTARAVTTRPSLTGYGRPAPFEHARQAFATGRLSLDALTTIVDGLRPLQRRCGADDVEAAESELVVAATGTAIQPPCTVAELRIMTQTWELYLDADGALPDEDSEHARTFRLGRERNKLFPIHANVTADVAAGLQRLLDAHLNPRVQDRTPRFVDAPVERSSDLADEFVPDPRTPDQKRQRRVRGHSRRGGGLGRHPDTWRRRTHARRHRLREPARPGGRRRVRRRA